MSQDNNQEPGKRLRSILSSPSEEKTAQPQPLEQHQRQSPLSQLPRLKPSVQAEAPKETANTPSPVPAPVQPAKAPASLKEKAGEEDKEFPRSKKAYKFGPPFWTITGILSLIVNGILIAVVLVLFTMIKDLQGLQGTATNIGSSVLGGLYTNFEKMDRATIKTTIPVDAQIPLDITVPVQTTTQITLSEAVSIPNAQVVINTGGLAINSNARVTLPAGTPMMVNLNFSLPVQTTIPVHLDVPVNIPMNQTELHEPFVGLQDVVRPWYCLVEPGASSVDGQVICK